MEKVVERPSGEICHRCLQPIALDAQRCPNCGERHTRGRHLPILIGILGVLALAFVIFVMVKVVRNADIEAAPADDQTEQSAPQQPEKPPPLNQ